MAGFVKHPPAHVPRRGEPQLPIDFGVDTHAADANVVIFENPNLLATP